MHDDQSTRRAILAGLDANDPHSIQRLIEFHRQAFGGVTMTATGTDPAGSAATSNAAGAPPWPNAAGLTFTTGTGPGTTGGTAGNSGGTGGKPPAGNDQADGDGLGDAGKAALQQERAAVKALQRQVADIQAAHATQMAKLAEVVGLQPQQGGKAPDGDSVLSGIRDELDTLHHERQVNKLARQHGIVDEDDLALLMSTRDPDTLAKIAGRLAPTPGAAGGSSGSNGGGRRPPAPDRSQGTGGGSSQPAARDQGHAEAQRRFAEKQGQTSTALGRAIN